MPDRTSCVLKLGGLLNLSALQKVAIAIEGARPYGLERQPRVPDIIATLTSDQPELCFDNVDYGEMPKFLEQELLDHCLSFAWAWNWGDELVPGVRLHDGRTGNEASFATTQDVICLPVHDLQDQARIASASRWHDFATSLVLQVSSSAHELAQLLASSHDLQAYHAAQLRKARQQ